MSTEITALVKKAQQGDEKAFEELYRKTYSYAYLSAFKIVKKESDAQDIAQEAFVEVQRSVKNLREPQFYFTWLNRIVYSKSMNAFKKNRIKTYDSQYLLDAQREERVYMLPQESCSLNDDRRVMQGLINNLDPKYRDVLYLYYFQNLKINEIAEKLKVPSGTIKSRMNRAKEQLAHDVRLFEKQEGRNLDFKLDGIPAVAAGGGFAHYLSSLKQSIPTLFSSMPLSSLVILTVISTVGIMTGSYYFLQSQHNSVPLVEHTQVSKEVFGTFTYDDKVVKDSKSAYFLCLSWAQDEKSMMDKTAGQFKRIQPIYERLKQTHSAYYQRLEEIQWAKNYEYYLKEYQ